ncbi:MAG: TIGR04255 family protein, partial [Euryarchaeota archaeon]|nr:TIGR04255 family protein [Euryarchaeota archaeon]
MMMPNNFLKQVILRLDFLGEIKLSQQVVNTIRGVVSDSFPEFKPQEKVLYEMTFEKAQAISKEKRTKAFLFHNNATNSSLSLDPNGITFDIKNYTTYQDFRDFVQRVIQNLGTENSSAKTSRIGLRYINQIIFNEGNPFDWVGLLRDPLTSNLNFIERQN